MNAIRRSLQHLLQWIRAHRPFTIAIIGTILVLIGSGIACTLLNQPTHTIASSIAPAPKPKPPVYYSPLTGLKVKDAASQKHMVTGVMIENSLDARPQSGLKEAGVVYEAIAEGGITRFLALYQESSPALIGPVRSLRPYDIDWLRPFDASIAHVGGSKTALDEIRNGKFRDIDQFFNSQYYWRSTDRYAPHNVYTNSKKLTALNKSKKYTSSTFTGFERGDEKPSGKPTATHITIDLSSSDFNPSYTYDAQHNTYRRFLGGVAHKDREKGQITPTVVIALMVKEKTVIEYGAPRENITTSGSGTVYIFQNGAVIKGTWHKKDQASQLTFTDSAGKTIPLARGQTWITAVPTGAGGVSWK